MFCVLDLQKLNSLFHCIDSLHLTIKFTMDYSTSEITFLGATVTKVGNKLEADLYCKPNECVQKIYCIQTGWKV